MSESLFQKIADIFQLRWYQQEALVATFKDIAEDVKNVLVSFPTACGKTRYFAAAAAALFRQDESRIIVMAHTEELVKQPLGVFEEFFAKIHTRAKFGVVQAGQRAYKADVMFCTVQTLSSSGCKAVYEILKHGPVDLLIVDETHHIVSKTYMQVKATLTSVEAWYGLRDEFRALRDRYNVINQLQPSQAIVVVLGTQEFDKLDDATQATLLKKEDKDSIVQRLGKAQVAFNESKTDLTDQLAAYLKKMEARIKREEWLDTADFSIIFPQENMLVVGVSATVFRSGDDISLGEAFQEIEARGGDLTYVLTIREAIQAGVLAPYTPIMVRTNFGADREADDEDVFDLPNGYELMIDRMLVETNPNVFPSIRTIDHPDGQEYVYEQHHQSVLDALKDGMLNIEYSMWFMPSVDVSRRMVGEVGSKYGLTFGHIDGTGCTIWDGGAPVKIDRAELLERFASRGNVVGLTNNMVLTEGYDAPHVTVEVIARRTTLYGPYVQMLGRVLRLDPLNPNKRALVLHPDYAGHQLKDILGLIGQPKSKDVKEIEEAIKVLMPGHEASIPPCPKCQGKLERTKGTRYYKCTSCEETFYGDDINDGLQGIFEEKRMSGLGTGAVLLKAFADSEVAWTIETVNGIKVMSVSIGVGGGRDYPKAERIYFILPPASSPKYPDGWHLIELRRPVLETTMAGSNRFNRYASHKFGEQKGYIIAETETLEEVMAIAQARIDILKDPKLADKDRIWRKKPISPKLASQLTQRFKMPESRVNGMNMGTGSRYYAHYNGLQYMRKATLID